MNTVLVTGANRGIGFGLVKYFTQLKGGPSCVIAVCRNPQKAEALQELLQTSSHLHIVQLDVSHFNSYDKFYENVQTIVKDNGLNLLVNNAGVTTKFTRLNLVKVEQMTENFTVNTIAPLMLTKALFPLLKKASEVNTAIPMGTSRAAVINISSIMGSISENAQGGFYPYRASKAALNAVTKSLSIDLKNDGILVTALHPGWIQTDMGGKNAPLTIANVVGTLINTIQSLGPLDTGGFIQYDGKRLPL